MSHDNSELTALLRCQIKATGPLSLARFMEVALYHAVHGYYQQPVEQIGCQGDFYTSVSVGNLLGRLLAFQFANWLDTLGSSRTPDRLSGTPTSPVQLVEAGAHDGQLALDILAWLRVHRPELLSRLEYWILEPSAARRQTQAVLLRAFAPRVRWWQDWNEVSPSGVSGIIFSNELLDAFPVFRLGWDRTGQKWFEWKVDYTGDHFAWVRDPEGISPQAREELATRFWRSIPAPLLDLLPDGFTIEVSPAARRWWTQAATSLHEGWLLTLDYGFEAHEFLAPHRSGGTLRGYSRHAPVTNVLARPGHQDLTAHVNFTALIEAGEGAGLQTEAYWSQAKFLTGIVAKALNEPDHFGAWAALESRQFQTLTHPQFLGTAFRLLLQTRSPDVAG